eukprot:1564320-Rhodomonas_salina.1
MALLASSTVLSTRSLDLVPPTSLLSSSLSLSVAFLIRDLYLSLSLDSLLQFFPHSIPPISGTVRMLSPYAPATPCPVLSYGIALLGASVG